MLQLWHVLNSDRGHMAQAFEEHCWNGPDPRGPEGWRSCYCDEHYFPTLLAINRMEEVSIAQQASAVHRDHLQWCLVDPEGRVWGTSQVGGPEP